MSTRRQTKPQHKRGENNWQKQLAILDGAYAESTIRAYRADIQCFVNWCSSNGKRPFPANPKLIARFISEDADLSSTSTIKRRLAAISKIHRLLKLTNPIQDEEVKLALRRAFRGKFARPKQALGLTAKMRDKLIEACSDGSMTAKRDRALISVGYDTLSRRSELSAICLEDIIFSDRGGSKVIIRRAKNDQYGQGRVAYISNKSTNFLKAWIKAAKIDSGPLFRSIKHNKIHTKAIHPHSINRIIKKAAEKAGMSQQEISNLSGHSMRVGTAQDMMIAGLDILPIMAAGGWKTTNVVARYIENADLSVSLRRRPPSTDAYL